jgi:oligoendopeptidase F
MPGCSRPATPIPSLQFYGDMQERITAASLHLLFSSLNSTWSTTSYLSSYERSALGHYRPWIEDIRKDKPYQLEDRVEQLFHENRSPAIPPESVRQTMVSDLSPASRMRSSRR